MNKRIPIIGIPGCKVGDDFFGSPISYARYAGYFGIPRILSLEEDVDERVDLLILTGGADVNPLRYGQIPEYYTGRPDPMKEYFDIHILPQYIEKGIPILGICRGIQTLAVHFGCKLVQHMTHPYSTEDRAEATHSLDLVPGTFKDEFEDAFGKKKIKVNSLHHQCVSNEGFSKDLEVLGIYPSKENASIEVIRHRTLPIYGVQYHPEELALDALGDFIVGKLLERSKNIVEQVKHNIEYV